MLPKELQNLVSALPQESQAVINLIAMYYESHYGARYAALEARVKEREDQLSKNNQNSSKPPFK